MKVALMMIVIALVPRVLPRVRSSGAVFMAISPAGSVVA